MRGSIKWLMYGSILWRDKNRKAKAYSAIRRAAPSWQSKLDICFEDLQIIVRKEVWLSQLFLECITVKPKQVMEVYTTSNNWAFVFSMPELSQYK